MITTGSPSDNGLLGQGEQGSEDSERILVRERIGENL
jgi:hypothetical protein